LAHVGRIGWRRACPLFFRQRRNDGDTGDIALMRIGERRRCNGDKRDGEKYHAARLTAKA
jgi:hypothetical protein